MANGYLGKISAVLSLNTASFQRGVNESARDTRAFARTIETNIRRASDGAQRSLLNILTPVQQLQASMQAAFSRRLSFRGFQGAIRDVEDLKRRLGSLDGRNVALVLNISGERSLADLQQRLREISNRDVRIVTEAGGERGLQAGLERLIQVRDELANDSGFGELQNQIGQVAARLAEVRELSAAPVGGGGDAAGLRAGSEEAERLSRSLGELEQRRRQLVSRRLGINIDSSELDQIIAKFQGLGPETVNRLINDLGAAQQQQSETRLTRLTQLADGITRPLEAAVADFGKLDMAVQAGFIPALSAAQNEVMGLERTLRETGDYGADAFNRVERQVDQTIIAIKQMKELSESVAGLKTGNEMVFQQPDLMATLASARKFGDRAAEAMPSLGGGDRADMVARLQLMRELGEQIERTNATMLNARQMGMTFIADDAQAELESLRQQMAALQAEGEQVIPVKVDTTQARAQIDPIAESLRRIRELADFSFTGNVQSFQQAQAEVNRIIAAFDRLDDATKAKVAPDVTALVGNFTAANGFFDADEIRRVATLVDAEAKAKRGADDVRAAMERIADGVNPSKPIDILNRSLDQAKAAVARLDGEQKAAGERQLARIERYVRATPEQRRDKATDEQAAAKAAAASDALRDRAAAEAARQEEARRAARQRPEATPAPKPASDPLAEAAARRADSGRSFADSFGGAGQQGLSLGIDQRSLRGVGAQIEYLQGRLVGLSAVARGPVVAAMERVRQVAATGFRDGTIGTAAFNRQLQNATSNLTRVAAAALNVRPGRLAEQLRRVGDVARGSFGNMGLAIQQGIFAFDDFFSVTGSLDQRIRAAGNNISQLGFIVGGTYGLIAGVAVSAVAQLTVGMLRWLGVTEDATNATKAMNSAIDSQRDKAKELADAYREVADSIAKAGLSKSGQSLLGQQQAAAGRQRQGEEAAIEAAASRSPRLAAARGLRDLEARNRQEATTIEGVLRAAARERTADEAVRRREAGILARARLAVDQNPSIDQARAAQIRNRERLAQAEGVDANEFTGDGRRRRRIARMRERDAELEARVQIARQRAAEGLVGAGQGVEARLGPLSQRLDEVGFTQAGRRIDDIFRSISDAMRDFQSGAMSQESLERFIAGLARASSEAEAAARPVLAFAESLKRLASGMARDAEESAGSLEKQLRNDANRLTGEGGANDPRTVAAMDSAARAAQVRSSAAIERLAIERDEARMRSQFEANLASGRGPAAAVDIARRMAVQDSILRDEESSPALKERARLAVEEYSLQLNEFVAALPEAAALKARSDALAASVAEFAKSVSDGAKAAEEEVAIRKALADRANPQGDVLRGLDLIERPVDAAFREIRQRVADFRAAADRVGLANNDRRDGLERILNDERRQVAPALFSMMEEVQNAVLSGPSRAALNASDASSVEGQRELNRLLRGEDSARDTNLVELEKQTEELRKLNDMIRAHGVAVANN